MDSNDAILLRRRILTVLDRAGAPLTLADLAERERDYGTTERALRSAVLVLEGAEYVANVYEPATPYYEITNAGRAQLERTAAKLDLKIWGRTAL